MISRRSTIKALAAIAASSVAAQRSLAQGTAAKIYTGFPPGGAGDVIPRLLAAKLGLKGHNYVVENRTGAGGRIAAEVVKNAAPDGQSVLITPDSVFALYPHAYKKLSYDPLNDFRAASMLAVVPLGVMVGPMVPASVRTLSDFSQWCKANPALASYGTSGAGTSPHFIGVMFARANRAEYKHVPYRGGHLAALDVANGQLASCINTIGGSLPLLSSGKLRLLAVCSPKRSSVVPDVPTCREAGFEVMEAETWYGLFLPARTPDAKVAELQNLAADAFSASDVRDTLASSAIEVRISTATSLADTLRKDLAHWGQVVRDAGSTAEE